MFVARVVDNQVHDGFDAALMERSDGPVQFLQRAEHKVNVRVIVDVVPVAVLRAAVDRRQPHYVDAQLGDMVHPPQNAGQIADAVTVGVLEGAGVDLLHHRNLREPLAIEALEGTPSGVTLGLAWMTWTTERKYANS